MRETRGRLEATLPDLGNSDNESLFFFCQVASVFAWDCKQSRATSTQIFYFKPRASNHGHESCIPRPLLVSLAVTRSRSRIVAVPAVAFSPLSGRIFSITSFRYVLNT